MTKELIESLPENVKKRITELKTEWKRAANRYGKYSGAAERVYEKMNGYANGLFDTGLINERERAVVIIYLHTNIDCNKINRAAAVNLPQK